MLQSAAEPFDLPVDTVRTALVWWPCVARWLSGSVPVLPHPISFTHPHDGNKAPGPTGSRKKPALAGRRTLRQAWAFRSGPGALSIARMLQPLSYTGYRGNAELARAIRRIGSRRCAASPKRLAAAVVQRKTDSARGNSCIGASGSAVESGYGSQRRLHRHGGVLDVAPFRDIALGVVLRVAVRPGADIDDGGGVAGQDERAVVVAGL